MEAPLKIYIAGKLNNMACEYITNVHNMCVWSDKVRRLGFSVYIPGIDFLMGMIFGDWVYDDYFNNSQPWLYVSDAVFVCPGWESSEGTKREIASAKERGIPVFFDCETLVAWSNNKGYRKECGIIE
jgi:hypothetical protein